MAIGDFYWSADEPARTPGPPINTRRPLVAGLIAGLLAALVLSIVMSCARIFGLSSLNLELNIGLILMRGQLEPNTWWVGFFGYLCGGAMLGLLYALVFKAGLKASLSGGVVLGILQWALAGVALGLLPRPACAICAPVYVPGFFGSNLGTGSSVLFGLVHVTFGVMVTNMFGSSAAARDQMGEVRELRPPEKADEFKRRAA